MHRRRLGHPLQIFREHIRRARKHLTQTGCGLACWGAQQNPLGTRQCQPVHKRQDAHNGRRFAGARSPADHQQLLIYRLRCRCALICRPRIIRKQCIEGIVQLALIDCIADMPGTPSDQVSQSALEFVVAVKIQVPVICQDKRSRPVAVADQSTIPKRLPPGFKLRPCQRSVVFTFKSGTTGHAGKINADIARQRTFARKRTREHNRRMRLGVQSIQQAGKVQRHFRHIAGAARPLQRSDDVAHVLSPTNASRSAIREPCGRSKKTPLPECTGCIPRRKR